MRYELKNVMVSSYSLGGSAADDSFDFKDMDTSKTGDADHDKWIDVLSTDWGTDKPGASDGYTASDDLFARDDRADTASDPLPSEEITLGYTEVEWTY